MASCRFVLPFAFGLPLALLLAGCSGGNFSSSGHNPPPSPTITSVTASCATAAVPVGQTTKCSSVLQGTGSFNSAVNWAVNSVQGGNATAGTVSAVGLYTAPAIVPTPFTVTVTATSVADATKSASFNVVVAGTIASASQTISASAGGTITLPDGSSVTIPAGLLTADQTITLTENSVPLNQSPNHLLAGAGPALSLTFSGPLPLQSSTTQGPARFNRAASSSSLLAGISFHFSFGANVSSAASIGSAIASFTNQAGEVLYQGISDAVDATTQTADAVISQGCISVIGSALSSGTAAELTIGVYFVDLAAGPANALTQGLLVWTPTAGQFLPFVPSQQCPAPSTSGEKVLVVIHGMLSSVEGSYTSMLGTTDFLSKGNYGPVFGIDYDWWNGLQQNGKTLAGYLDQVVACAPGVPIDILAHSEGVPVTISALTLDTVAKSSVQHFIAIAGPILGTPLANAVTGPLGTGRYALLTAIGNFPFLQMVFPPASPGGLLDLLNDQFAKDLATDSTGSGVLDGIRNLWIQDPVLSKLPIVMVGGTFPDPLFAGEYIPLGACINNCFGSFTHEPFDGVVGLDSAFGQGLDLPLYRVPAEPLFHTAMVDNPGILSSLELQLNNSQPPKLEISTTASNTSCLSDGHSCSGSPGSVFTFKGSGFTPGRPILGIYVQDPTGTQVAPVSATAQSDGTFTWNDATLSTKVPGTYGVWIYDLDHGASNSVIETICSGNCGTGTPAITVNISPTTVTLVPGATQSFSVVVSGTISTAVTWSATGGTITSTGLYTAPVVAGTYSVVAASQADPTVTATAIVTVSGVSSGVTISPVSVSVPESGTQTFTAPVSGGGGVIWSVQEGTSGGTITSTGIYTAPNTAGTFHVVATGVADLSQSAAAVVTVVAGPIVTTLHSFDHTTEGANPWAALIQGSDGNFYGTTEAGGNLSCSFFTSVAGCGTAFKMDTSGKVTVLHAFSGQDGAYPDTHLIQTKNGSLYGTTTFVGLNISACLLGGTSTPAGCGTVFKVDTSGGFTPVYSFSSFSSPEGVNPDAALIQASDGDLYGATSEGGNISCAGTYNSYSMLGCGSIFQIDLSNTLTTLHSFSGSDGAYPFTSLLQATDGNFYGVTAGGGNLSCASYATPGCGTVFKMTSPGTIKNLHSFRC